MSQPDPNVPAAGHEANLDAVDTRQLHWSSSGTDDIVIVGPCASGKSTLAGSLVQLGYHARVVGQEHSDIQRLWQRHDPAMVIGLRASLETIRARRGRDWSRDLYDRQQRRLQPAMAAAAIILDTECLSPIATLAAATAAIREAGIRPTPPVG